MSSNTSISSTASFGLDNNKVLSLDTALAVVVASNHTYSDDPPRISAAYTYYWELTKKPPDITSTQSFAILGIFVGCTILVVYITWKICGQQFKQSSCHKRQKHLSNYGTGVTPTVQKDGLFVFDKPTNTTADEAPTSFFPLESKPALDFRGPAMKFQPQRAQHTLNDPLFFDPKEFEGMTVGEMKTAFSASLSNKWRHPNNDGSGITPAAQQDGLFVFGKPTGTTACKAPPSSSSLGPTPLFEPAIQFPMKSASIGTFSVMPASRLPTRTSSLFAWPPTPTDSSSSALEFEMSVAVTPQQQRVRHDAKPPANVLIELLHNNRPDYCTKKEWNRFVTKNWTSLLNHLQHRPKRLYQAKILTPLERQLLVELEESMPDFFTITKQRHRVSKMKATLKAGGRRCSNHYQSGFRKSVRHCKPKSPIPTITIHCPHCKKRIFHKNITNLPHNTWRRRKRDRTDSEAVTNSSNRRLRKPD